MTHKGIPDFQRSARQILKDFVNVRHHLSFLSFSQYYTITRDAASVYLYKCIIYLYKKRLEP